MEFGWSDEEDAFRHELRDFLDVERPGWRGEPRRRAVMTAEDKAAVLDFTAKLAERKWLTPAWPEEYGGTGQTAWQGVILSEELWSIGEPRGSQYMNVNWIGPALMMVGTQDQKDFFLNRISKGDIFFAQGFSEPDAGSDLASLKTAAVRDGDEYVINGQKIWTSHTPSAEWIFVLVRTDPTAPKHRGITILLVPIDTPGIEVRRIPDIGGEGVFSEVFFTDARVPVSTRLGDENAGWGIVRRALQFERVGAARWERASLVLDNLVDVARAEGVFDDPDIARRFGEAYAQIDAARWAAYEVVDERAKEVGDSPTAYPVRVAMVRAERAVAELALEILGTEALVADTFPDGAFRAAITAGVAGGTYEIQLNLIAGQLLGLPRD